MSKSTQSIIMLVVMGLGLSGFGIYQIIDGIGGDRIVLGLFYIAAGIVAFGCLLNLRTKPIE